MQKINATITAVGGYVPEYRLTNAILETLVDTTDEWIKTRTGIEERRILKGEGLATSDMGVPAVLELCKKRGIDPLEIAEAHVHHQLAPWTAHHKSVRAAREIRYLRTNSPRRWPCSRPTHSQSFVSIDPEIGFHNAQ